MIHPDIIPKMSSFSITDFLTRTELIAELTQSERDRAVLMSQAEAASERLSSAVRSAIMARNRDAGAVSAVKASSTPNHHHTPARLATAATLTFNSPSESNEQQQHQHPQLPSQTATVLSEQRKALAHELDTLRSQLAKKKTSVQSKSVEVARLRFVTETVLPRAEAALSRAVAAENGAALLPGDALRECREAVDASLLAAHKREAELRKRLFDTAAAMPFASGVDSSLVHGERPQHAPSSTVNSTTAPSSGRVQLLKTMLAKLDGERGKKAELVASFERRVKENEVADGADETIKSEIKLLEVELATLLDREKFLRHLLAVDAVRRVVENKHSQLRQGNSNSGVGGRGSSKDTNAHGRMSEAMAFLKAEVLHFGHDIRAVQKALADRNPLSVFKQAHNEMKIVVGLMLGSEAAASFQRRQGAAAWPVTPDMIVDRFPAHKVTTVYAKLQEMVVAWDSLSREEQEQLSTAQDVVANAEVLLMMSRHVSDLHQEKRNQMSAAATVASSPPPAAASVSAGAAAATGKSIDSHNAPSLFSLQHQTRMSHSSPQVHSSTAHSAGRRKSSSSVFETSAAASLPPPSHARRLSTSSSLSLVAGYVSVTTPRGQHLQTGVFVTSPSPTPSAGRSTLLPR